ncbi:restriction endonuclease subunit S [Holdemanella porci]|mgnify:FL=1|uniref:restriction endonuclease subunit S n=1 Tax=Holdemanella porci TaxID=2652276 RepID=UPI003AF13F94
MKIKDFIDFEQPNEYIVESDRYSNECSTPVLTAGKSFILGYTNEGKGIYKKGPCIIFDDFTTSVHYVDFPFKVKSSAMKILTAKSNADLKYCYYLLLSLSKMPPNHKRQWISTTSEKNHVLPSMDRQISIVKQLDLISDTIVNYTNQIENLDNLVKARFIEMFGDLKSNEKDWNLKTFEEMSVLITDGEHSTPKRTKEGIYLLSARNVLNHSLQLKDVDYINRDEYLRIAKRVVPKKGDILISCSGTIGRCCSVPDSLQLQMVRSVALIRFKEVINPIFAEYMITSDYLQEQINSSKTMSSQANLFQGKIRKLKGFLPPTELQNQFADFVEQVNKSREVVKKSLEKTQQLYDSLMQEYFG